MPGGHHLRSFRLGNRGELLAQHLLSAFAFTTPAPRQEDVGFDFFCSLVVREGRFLNAGPFFTVQVKSTADPVVFTDEHEIAWIMGLENPHLHCVANRDTLSMDIYSTWNVMCGQLAAGRHPVTLRPGEAPPNFPGVVHNDDQSQEIYLGDPIVRVTSEEVFDEARVDRIASVINDWITFDRLNIVNRHAGTYWVEGPLAYRTGEPPFGAGHGGVAFYWNLDNLPGCARNLGRVSTAISLILRDHLPGSEHDARRAALREVLRTHWDLIDDSVKSFLRSQGLGFDP